MVTILLLILLRYTRLFSGRAESNLREPKIIADRIKVEKTKEEIIKRQGAKIITLRKNNE